MFLFSRKRFDVEIIMAAVLLRWLSCWPAYPTKAFNNTCSSVSFNALNRL